MKMGVKVHTILTKWIWLSLVFCHVAFWTSLGGPPPPQQQGMHHHGTDSPKERIDVAPPSAQHPSRRPLVLFHFGPRKTGSTTIQNFMTRHQSLMNRMGIHFYWINTRPTSRKDNIGFYLTNCVMGQTYNCFSEDEKNWKKFEAAIQNRRLAYHGNETFGDHGMISTTIFSWEDVPRHTRWNNHILDVLEAAFQGYDHRVTLTYRHFPSWYLSEYNQEQKSRNWRIFPLLGFVDWHRATRDERKMDQHMPIAAHHLAEYRKRFGRDSLVVFRMPEGDGDKNRTTTMVQDWVCQTLPEHCTVFSNQTRKLLEKQKTDNLSKNNLEQRRLAQKVLMADSPNLSLAARKISNKAFDRLTQEVGQWLAASHHHDQIPLQCLSSAEKKALWRQTLQTRDDLLPGYDPRNTALRNSFEVHKDKFCQVDYDRLSQWESWKKFIHALKVL